MTVWEHEIQPSLVWLFTPVFFTAVPCQNGFHKINMDGAFLITVTLSSVKFHIKKSYTQCKYLQIIRETNISVKKRITELHSVEYNKHLLYWWNLCCGMYIMLNLPCGLLSHWSYITAFSSFQWFCWLPDLCFSSTIRSHMWSCVMYIKIYIKI